MSSTAFAPQQPDGEGLPASVAASALVFFPRWFSAKPSRPALARAAVPTTAAPSVIAVSGGWPNRPATTAAQSVRTEGG